MNTYVPWMLSLLALTGNALNAEAEPTASVVILRAADATAVEQLAALEVQRYVYLRSGQLLPIVTEAPAGDAIVVSRQDAAPAQPMLASIQPVPEPLSADAYWLRTQVDSSGTSVYLAGGSDVATLYAAYRFAEHLGVRFYLHGDEYPEQLAPLVLPELDERHAPLFELRGIQPFHDFPEGPDWWNPEDYKAILAQLPKLRMNFFGLHTYPEDRPAAEPTVWIGTPENVTAEGDVTFAYPAIWYNTALPVGWGFHAKQTGKYGCGAGALFDRDDYGSDVMRSLTPRPDRQRDCIELFERTGEMFDDAFTFARTLGIKTCIGTETPLITPRRVAEAMVAAVPGLKPEGGKPAQFTAAIEGTDDDELYQSVRYDLDAYRCAVTNGVYKVTLHFCEPAYGEAGRRVFGVRLEGAPVIESLDIFAQAGMNRALDFVFENIQVQDGRLDIEFTRQIEFPCIGAIAVEGEGVRHKVNCCGSAYKDYVGENAMSLEPEQIATLYEGIFTRIMRRHPLDYYWFWTPENWTWEDVSPEVVERTMSDLRIAYDAASRINVPFQLATCGWVLGPQYDRALLGNELPKEMAVSCINRAVGHDPVEPGFASVQDRGKWAIPWLEDDPAMTSAQLWVGRMRRDARDALNYGCNGLMGIHWRTRILGPNVAALAQAAWEQDGWTEQYIAQTGPVGGMPSTGRRRLVAGTEDDAVYRDARAGMTAYRIAAPNGTYKVTFQFCEMQHKEGDRRVFSVNIEGARVVDHLDICKEAGARQALDRVVEAIEVRDSQLSIDFIREKDEPVVSGIVVEGAEVAIKINCGGEAYQDYIADPQPLLPHVPSGDFYLDWANTAFGTEVAGGAAAIFAKVDGQLPRPSNWIGGPGGYVPEARPWTVVEKEYAFVDELAALRPGVIGLANLERFDYWLSTLQFLRATAKMCCRWQEFNVVLERAKAAPDVEGKVRIAREEAVPKRIALVRAVVEAYEHLLATVSTSGEMGTICNLEQHTFPAMLDAPGKELTEIMGAPLPAEAQLPRLYAGGARLVVTTKRTSLESGEPLQVRTTLLDRAPAMECRLYWRPLGAGEFQRVTMKLLGRHTMTGQVEAAKIPAAGVEYYVEALTSTQHTVRWPVTAPALNQTVVIMPAS